MKKPTNEEIMENVKAVNKTVEYAQKYLKEHSKEVYEINIKPIGFEEGHLEIQIIFSSTDPQLKEAQKQLSNT